jgi:diguanylate cyclase (GGDEF)-like protein
MDRFPVMKKKCLLFLLFLYLAPAAGWGQDLEALTARGEAEQNQNDHKAARATFREALDLLEKIGGAPSPRLLKGAGLSELVLGDYEKSLAYLLRALAAAEKSGDRENGSASAYLIGYVHRDLQNFDLALQYFREAYESGLELGNQRRVIMALNEIGNVHVFQEQFAAALPYKERSLKLARENGDPDLLANGLQDMGNIHLAQEDAAKALPYLQEALAIYRKLGQTRGILISLINIADASRRLGRSAAAMAALDESRVLAEKTGQEKDLSGVLLMYSLTHEGMKDYRQALDFLHRYLDLRERLFSNEKSKQTVDMQTRYEVEKKQRENEILKREKQISALALAKQRNQRNFLFFVALLVLALAGVLYRGIRNQARANHWLEEANSRIVAQQGKLEKAYNQMEELARRDQLTGLPNRRAALEELEREEKRFQRSQKPFTLVMADLVGFKTVNDTLGHDAGDHVLKAAAGIFSGSLRAQDTVARWGGDEFLFLLPATDAAGARVTCDAIAAKITAFDFSSHGRPLKVSASMGTATFRAGLTVEECLREADQAMYRGRER